MTAAPIAPLVARTAPLTADVLAPLHEHWLTAAQRIFAPVLHGRATMWDRWTAVRHVRQVANRLEEERRVMDLTPHLAPSSRVRIEDGFDALMRVRHQIAKVGGRERSGALLSHLLSRFVELLAEWYAAVEHAAAWVPLDELPTKALAIMCGLESENRS
jgi:hypothetical protein